jgi:hypothetical protein
VWVWGALVGDDLLGKWMLVDTTWNHSQLRPNEVPFHQPRALMGRGDGHRGREGATWKWNDDGQGRGVER